MLSHDTPWNNLDSTFPKRAFRLPRNPMTRNLIFINRRQFLAYTTVAATTAVPMIQAQEKGFVSLFNGKDLSGWEGDPFLWKVEDGMLVGRSPGISYNDFLSSTKEYSNFVLRFEVHLLNNIGNSGVQLRSRRAPGSMEMIGYQADIGPTWWGNLYDESRRRVTLAEPPEGVIVKALKPLTWNDYEVSAVDKRITLKLNGKTTIQYDETDDSIEGIGLLALQVHSGPPLEVRFRNIRIQEL